MASKFTLSKSKNVNPETSKTHLTYTVDIEIEDMILPKNFLDENFNSMDISGDRVIATKACYDFLINNLEFKENIQMHNHLSSLISILENVSKDLNNA